MQKLELPKVSKNSLTLFYFVEKEIKLENIGFKTIENYTNPMLLNELDTDHLKKITQLWAVKTHKIDNNFLPKIKKLFNNDNDLINTYTLEKKVIEAINNQGNGLSLNFSNATAKRLKDVNTSELYTCEIKNNSQLGVGYKIIKVLLHKFQTGFSVIEFEISAKNKNNTPLASPIVLEAFDDRSISCLKGVSLFFNDKQCINPNNSNKSTTFSDLAYGIVGMENPDKHSRVYTHAFVEFRESIDENTMSQYSIKLAKHYNDDYHIMDNNDDNVEIIKHFENVMHCYSREGASTVVAYRENDSDHIRNFLPSAIYPRHIPIHLLVFHLEKALNVYAISTIGWIDIDKEIPITKLQELECNQVTLRNFDINFIHNIISALSRYNLIYQKLIKVMSIKEQYQRIVNNSQVITQIIKKQEEERKAAVQLIKEKEAKKRELKYCQLGKWGAGAVSFLTVTEIIKEIIEIIMHNYPETVTSLEHNGALIGLTLSVIVSVFSMVKMHKHCSEKNEHNQHNTIEHVEHSTHRSIRLKKQRN